MCSFISKTRRILSRQMMFTLFVFMVLMFFCSSFYLQRKVRLCISYSTDVDQKLELRLLEDPGTRFNRKMNRPSEIILPASRTGNGIILEVPAPTQIAGFTIHLAENSHNLFLNSVKFGDALGIAVPGKSLIVMGTRDSTCSIVSDVLKLAPNKNTMLCHIFPEMFRSKLRILLIPLLYSLIFSLIPALLLNRHLSGISDLTISEYIYCSIVLLLLVLPVLKIDYYSVLSQENRFLADFPSIFSEQSINDQFPRKFEKWFEDRCTLRTQLIHLEKKIFSCGDRTLSAKSGDVLIGKQGWLFTRTANSIEMACNRNLFTDEQLKTIAENLKRLDLFLKKEYGSNLYITLLPDKEHIYFEYYPEAYKRTGALSRLEQLADYLKAKTDLAVIMPQTKMLVEKQAHQIFFKKGTHWTPHGALVAMRILVERIHEDFPKFPKSPANVDRWVCSHEADVDLAKSLGYSDPLHQLSETDLVFENPVVETGYSVETLRMEGSYLLNRMISQNSSATEKVFICSDSFWWNCLPFFTPLCRESLHLCCSGGVGFNLRPYLEEIKKLRPSIVVMETTERFLDRFVYLENYGE